MKNYFFTFWISGVLMLAAFMLAAIGTPNACIFSGICFGFWFALIIESWRIEDDRKRGRHDD